MRTAADFNNLYETPDPWGLRQIRFRERVLRRLIQPYIAGKSVLELGCGEGHSTRVIFCDTRLVDAVDISDVAIERAKQHSLSNANFLVADLVDFPFGGYDVIAAIECLYYLAQDERVAVLRRLASEHRGKLLILSVPIIGQGAHQKYFTHDELMGLLRAHGALRSKAVITCMSEKADRALQI